MEPANLITYHADGKQVEWSVPRYLNTATQKPVRHGEATCFYPSGAMKISRMYVHGMIDGSEVLFYPNGMIHTSCEYKGNLRNGEFRSYLPDGKLEIVCQYLNDRKHGAFVRYDENGQVAFEKVFHNGV